MRFIADSYRKGAFTYTYSTRQDDSYDIYFIPEGSKRMEYIATVSDNPSTYCELFEEQHNQAVEIRSILETAYNSITNWSDNDHTEEKIEEGLSKIEAVLDRPLSQKERNHYYWAIREWDC
jgi:hypothetical protein